MAVRRVVLICFPGMELLDLAGPSSVFDAATRLGRRNHGYRLELVAQAAGPVETLVLEDCGHSPHKDQPERTRRLVADFLAPLS